MKPPVITHNTIVNLIKFDKNIILNINCACSYSNGLLTKDDKMKSLQASLICFVTVFATQTFATSSEGYQTFVSCVTQTETAKVTSEFKTVLGRYNRTSLTIAKINGVEFKLDEVPTAGPLVLALKSVTSKQAEITLKNLVINKVSEEISVTTFAGLEQLAATCKIEITSDLR